MLARKLRPGGRWGWYNFPGEAGSAPDDDSMLWLYESVNALFPSIYLESADAATNVVRVDKQLSEARRVRDEVSKVRKKLGQLQHFIAVFPQECMGRLASFGPT
jgi:hypothetical protein